MVSRQHKRRAVIHQKNLTQILEVIDEIEFAKQVCNDEADYRSTFLKEFHNEILFAVAKLVRVNTHDLRSDNRIRVKDGFMAVNDERSDCYLWLSEYLFKKCCEFKSEKDATLKTYINSIINPLNGRNWLRNDWLRHKNGDNRYIPKEIKQLDKRQQLAFVMIRRKFSYEMIYKKTGLSKVEVEKLVHKSQEFLSKQNFEYYLDDKIEEFPSDVETGSLEKTEQKKLLRKQIKLLEETDRIAFVQYLEENSYQEIADYLNKFTSSNSWTIKKIEHKLSSVRKRVAENMRRIYGIT